MILWGFLFIYQETCDAQYYVTHEPPHHLISQLRSLNPMKSSRSNSQDAQKCIEC